MKRDLCFKHCKGTWASLIFGAVLALLLCSQSSALAYQASPIVPMRIWTNQSGVAIQAEALSFQGNNVVLRKPDGSTYSYPVQNLSNADQAQLKSAARGQLWRLKGGLSLMAVMIFVGWLMTIYGSLTLLVYAWAEGIWWFLSAIFLGPIAIPIFVVTYWHENKRPFFVATGGGLIVLVATLIPAWFF